MQFVPTKSAPSLTTRKKSRSHHETRSCKICRSEYRDVIELMTLNGDSFARNAALVSSQFPLKVSATTLFEHMRYHGTTEREEPLGILLQYIDDEGNDVPLLTTDGLVKLLAQILAKIVAGEIGPRNVSDVLRIIELDQNLEQRKLQRETLETGIGADAQGSDEFRQLACIMTAARQLLPPDKLERFLQVAREKGLCEELAGIAEVPRVEGTALR